mgnify:CR=1 FL=1
MKKSTKIISLLLAVMMVVALMPTMAFAEESDKSDNVMGSVIDVINGIQIPDYLVYCSLASRIPASHAQITLTNVNGDTSVSEANALGLALIPKGLLGIYNVAATCDGMITGLKYSTLPGITWTMSIKPEVEELVLYPVLNIGLNYTDHFSYMIGYNDGTVRPNGTITRAEVATMIFRLMTPEARDKVFTKDNSFSDVNTGNPHNNAISSLAKAGIINGYADGTFRPFQPVTREQFAAMIGRMFSVEYTGSGIFGDLNGGFADKYINLLAKLGIIKGDANGNANPTDNLTRAQAATMFNRLVGRMPAVDSAASCEGYVKTWSDCPADMWCYGEILEATNSHNYTWATDLGNVLNNDTALCEEWTNIRTDTPDWSALQK